MFTYLFFNLPIIISLKIKDPKMKRHPKNSKKPRLDKGKRGPLLEPDLGGELVAERLVARPGSTGTGRAKPEKTTWSRLPVGSPPAGRVIGPGCIANWVVGTAPFLKPSSWRGAGLSSFLQLPRV